MLVLVGVPPSPGVGQRCPGAQRAEVALFAELPAFISLAPSLLFLQTRSLFREFLK